MFSYEDTLNYIFNLRGGEIDLRLHRMEQALSVFGHPERQYLSFHIAGTNGKGSTAAMLHSILSAQGYRVALYTSPHLVSFTERIRVGASEISPEEVVGIAGEIKERMEREGIVLTFYEFVTVMALIYFARSRVDVAVVEVGLGGRLDATNLVVPRTSIITTISRDHENYLGSGLLSIAREKGGIIKQGVPVVCGFLPPEAAGLIRELAEGKASPSYFLGRDFSFALREKPLFDYRGFEWHFSGLSLALRGKYQKANATLALGALEVARADFPVAEASVREGLVKVSWPGRFEVISERPKVILDGAHNGEGVRALVDEIRDIKGDSKVRLLFASMEDKDWPFMLRELSSVASELVLTRVPISRSADPWTIARSLEESPIPVKVIEDPGKALCFLLEGARRDEVILVTGSLYLLGEVRPLLLRGRRT